MMFCNFKRLILYGNNFASDCSDIDGPEMIPRLPGIFDFRDFIAEIMVLCVAHKTSLAVDDAKYTMLKFKKRMND